MYPVARVPAWSNVLLRLYQQSSFAHHAIPRTTISFFLLPFIVHSHTLQFTLLSHVTNTNLRLCSISRLAIKAVVALNSAQEHSTQLHHVVKAGRSRASLTVPFSVCHRTSRRLFPFPSWTLNFLLIFTLFSSISGQIQLFYFSQLFPLFSIVHVDLPRWDEFWPDGAGHAKILHIFRYN